MYITFVLFIVYIVFSIIICINKIPKKQVIEGLNTFNGRMAVDDQYFYDKIFDDVKYYPNQYATKYDTGEDIDKLLMTGMMKCYDECSGKCVEYGISGNAYCFPY